VTTELNREVEVHKVSGSVNIMKRYLDSDVILDLINENFKSKSDFCRKAKLSRSHFDGMINGDITVGLSSQSKLMRVLKDQIDSIEDILIPLPINMGGKLISEICVTDKNGGLVASITSRDEITDKRYVVEYLPYNH
jgi:hypothetical protein